MAFRWLCFLVLFSSLQAAAMDVVVSHTVFYKPGSGTGAPSAELYWLINPNTLHYNTNSDSKLVGNVRTDIVVLNKDGVIREDHYIMQTVPRADLADVAAHPVIELKSYDVPAGMIKVRMVLTDMGDSLNRFVYVDSFMATPYREEPFMSEIELLDTFYSSNGGNVFTKNGKVNVPACSNFVRDGKNTLGYYAEAYNLNKIKPGDYPLIVRVAISKNEAEGYYGELLQTDTIRKPISQYGISGQINIASLPSGNYYVRAGIEHSGGETVASQSLFFQRMNRHPYVDTAKPKANLSDTGIEKVTVLNLKKTFIARYNNDQVKAILKMLLPFSDQNGRQTINGFLKKPDEMYMRYYIYNYFAAVNPRDPAKAWKEFSLKIAEVNKLYNSHNTPGYETDRGIVYLRYGAPTEVITADNEQGTLPYEIWMYNTLTQTNRKTIANAVFLFYKPDHMLLDYRLLHSNVSGEPQNIKWRSVIYTMQGANADYSSSRAEQILGNK